MIQAYGWLVEGGSKEQIDQIEAQLNKPPAGAKKEAIRQDAKWDQQNMADNFMAQLAARNGNARVSK